MELIKLNLLKTMIILKLKSFFMKTSTINKTKQFKILIFTTQEIYVFILSANKFFKLLLISNKHMIIFNKFNFIMKYTKTIQKFKN